MDKSKIDELIDRAKSVHECDINLEKMYIDNFEKQINVKLANDFLYIASFYYFEYLCKFDWAGFESKMYFYTEYYRTKGLPHRYIILADEGDGGIVLMETQADREKPSPVVWCDYPDIFNLCECGEFKLNPDIWPSFTDFFEYLVEQEEKLQNEELN